MPSVDVGRHLDELIEEHGLDAFLQFDDASNSNQLYASGFEAHDEFVFLRHRGDSILVVAPLEKGRAETESTADKILSTAEYVSGDVRGDTNLEIEVIRRCLDDRGIDRVGVPRDFPVYIAEQLDTEGVQVESVRDVIIEARKRKDEDEIADLAAAQSVTEEAMNRAEELLRQSEVRDGQLYHDGKVLTAERLRSELRVYFLEAGHKLDEAIVACGPPGADPHYIGSGPLRAGEPILFDIYPEHESGYWGDMSRTFVKGEPGDELRAMYKTTLDAFDAALDVLSGGAGVTGSAVHDAVCDVFEAADYPTVREGDIDEGFLHSTGHAIGLDLHEVPRLVSGAQELNAGYVLTVEPGLYDSDIGGVRVEDMIVVTEDGYRNLNDYHTELVL